MNDSMSFDSDFGIETITDDSSCSNSACSVNKKAFDTSSCSNSASCANRELSESIEEQSQSIDNMNDSFDGIQLEAEAEEDDVASFVSA